MTRGMLVFTLCCSCAEENIQRCLCAHGDDRVLTGAVGDRVVQQGSDAQLQSGRDNGGVAF